MSEALSYLAVLLFIPGSLLAVQCAESNEPVRIAVMVVDPLQKRVTVTDGKTTVDVTYCGDPLPPAAEVGRFCFDEEKQCLFAHLTECPGDTVRGDVVFDEVK